MIFYERYHPAPVKYMQDLWVPELSYYEAYDPYYTYYPPVYEPYYELPYAPPSRMSSYDDWYNVPAGGMYDYGYSHWEPEYHYAPEPVHYGPEPEYHYEEPAAEECHGDDCDHDYYCHDCYGHEEEHYDAPSRSTAYDDWYDVPAGGMYDYGYGADAHYDDYGYGVPERSSSYDDWYNVPAGGQYDYGYWY